MAEISNTSWTETDGGNVFPPPAGWPAGMFPNAVEPTAQAMMGAVKRFWNRVNPAYQASLSTTDSFVITPTQPITGYGLYERWRARFPSANITTSPTIVISSLPAQPIKKYNGSGGVVNVTTGDIQAQDHGIWWDGSEMILENPASIAAASQIANGATLQGTLQGSSGVVYVGFTGDQGGAQNLQVNSSAYINGTISLVGSANAAPSSNGQGYLSAASTVDGLQIFGKGSSNDIELRSAAGALALAIPTGTQNVAVPGALEVGSPSGGMPSAGVINATGFQVNGVSVVSPFSAAFASNQFPIPGNASSTSATHTLGGLPFFLRSVLHCTTSDTGYVTGEEVPLSQCFIGAGLPYFAEHADSANVNLTTISTGSPELAHAVTGAFTAITANKWAVVLKAVK